MSDRVPVKTAATVFDVVETLLDLEGARFTDLVAEMDKPRSTLHDHLTTLESMGLVVKDDEEYRVGTRFLEIGARARRQRDVYEAGRPQVEKLADETGEHASLAVEERGRGVLMHVAKGENAVNLDAYAGRRFPLHANAAGKAILAHLPESRVDEIFEGSEMVSLTPYTKTDPAALKAEFEEIREQGYATDTSELVEGVRAISAPVLRRDELIGVINVGGPANRMGDERFEEGLPDSLLSASNIIELNLTYG